MSFQCIRTFQDVIIKSNTLVICDIDDTVIKCKKPLNHFYQMVKEDFCFFSDCTHEMLLKEAWDMQIMYNQLYGYTHTDSEGFEQMLNSISQTKSQLIFLTARSKQSDQATKKNLNQAGIYHEDFQIHYTKNEITKGQYIVDHIDLSGFDHVVFIDDYENQVLSVVNLVGKLVESVSGYKFEIPGHRDIENQGQIKKN